MKINGENIVVDSLKVRIPLEHVEILNSGLVDRWTLVNTNTGEEREDVFKKNSYSVDEDGYKTYYGVEKQINEYQQLHEYLIILLPAKLLESKYFEGIRKDNILLVYDRLMKQGVVKFTHDVFLNKSGCTDIDFKYDFGLMEGMNGEPVEIFSEWIGQLKKLTKPSVERNKGATIFNKRENQGIQWSKREWATPSNPYFKFYNKKAELSHKKSMREFALKHLDPSAYKNHLFRAEFTVKNKKSLAWHKIEGNTLNDILSIPSEVKVNMLYNSLQAHLISKFKSKRKKINMDFNSVAILNCIESYVQDGLPYYPYIRDLLSTNMVGSQKSKALKKFDALYEEHVADEDYTKPSEEISHWFKHFGIG